MSVVVGGIRNRLIFQSLALRISEALGALNWDQVITFSPEPIPDGQPIELDTLAMSYEAATGIDIELGSNLNEETWTVYFDFYASKESLGLQLASDLRDALRGKMPSIGFDLPSITVYDWRENIPPELFTVEIENVVLDIVRDGSKPWQKRWYIVRCDLIDTYGDEDYG